MNVCKLEIRKFKRWRPHDNFLQPFQKTEQPKKNIFPKKSRKNSPNTKQDGFFFSGTAFWANFRDWPFLAPVEKKKCSGLESINFNLSNFKPRNFFSPALKGRKKIRLCGVLSFWSRYRSRFNLHFSFRNLRTLWERLLIDDLKAESNWGQTPVLLKKTWLVAD